MALCALPFPKDLSCESTLMFPHVNLMRGTIELRIGYRLFNRQHSVIRFLTSPNGTLLALLDKRQKKTYLLRPPNIRVVVRRLSQEINLFTLMLIMSHV